MNANDKSGRPPPSRRSRSDTSSGNKQVVYTLFASAAAGIATWYYSFIHTPTSFTVLPASYALCAGAGKIYTADSVKPNVDCIVVDKQTILTTGTLPEAQSWWDDYQNELVKKWYGNEPSAKKPLPVMNVRPGSTVVPGLADAHAHILQYGFKMQLPLDNARSLSELLDTLEDYVRKHPSGPDTWIEAMGWDHTRWSDSNGAFPNSADIASRPALASLPIVLHRVDGHAIWISPRALELTKAHLGGSFPETVPGGDILRDTSGEPTGIFVDAAQSLVPVPKWSTQQMREYADRAVKDAVAVGLTSIHDAMTSVAELELFQRLESENKLPIRVYAMADTDRLTSEEANVLSIDDRGPAARVRMRSVKVFTDGALGSWGAALLSPYSDKPEVRGIMRYSEEELSTIVRGWWEKGWGVNIHAIGDRANKAVLDIFENIGNGLKDKEEVANRRPRIEHAQIMRVEDLERAGTLGVITSVQPTHATSDMNYAEARLGPERIKGAYAYQTLLKSSRHGILPLGSDFPVESINPLYGFYAAVSRLDTEGNSPHGERGWYPAERLTRAQALKGMTLDAAYAAFAEDVLGSLSPGKRADYVILDRDIMDENQPVDDILKAQVKATIVDGKVVYGGV
ncbi:amidohydrolase family-domain-containing protein [Ganoderma leucocontextum]|nr:amidohydrolase family-domain-containing protein [Ganoderma leucocontextum]